MGSEQNRFPQQERRKRWGGCFAAFSCFGATKGGKRIVPASRAGEGNQSSSQQNGHQPTGNQVTTLAPSLLAPPSSPASFTHSAIPSTVQSPSCFLSLSASSPGGPSSTMFATGPYAHETQLVSPPVFSTFTTEPSTAPLTPPPELAHLTTPSSPDVPFAQFLTSSLKPRHAGKINSVAANDLHASYSLYPGSPAASLRSPQSTMSGDCSSPSFPEREWSSFDSCRNGMYSRSGSGKLFNHDVPGVPKASKDSNFFCPATFAQFYLDQNPNTGGRISVSKDSDTYPASGNGHLNRYNRSPKQDAEELEAYRASFGFSADEIISTAQYVEISDPVDDSFTMTPFPSNGPSSRETLPAPASVSAGFIGHNKGSNLSNCNEHVGSLEKSVKGESPAPGNGCTSQKLNGDPTNVLRCSTRRKQADSDDDDDDDDDVFAKASSLKTMRKYQLGLSSSDAEIDYRRGRSIRESRGDLRRRG